MFPSPREIIEHNTITSGELSEQLLLVLLLMQEHDEPECHFALDATIASGRYMSRLLP